MWELYFTKQAKKDAKKLVAAGLKEKAAILLEVLRENPYQNPPPYEKLVGDLKGAIQEELISNTGSFIRFWKKKKR